MNSSWKYVKKLEDADSVETLINRYGLKIPDYLIKCLKNHNGGRPQHKDLITDTGHAYVFNSLLSFNKGDHPNIYFAYPSLFKESDLFPFGMTSDGNFVCFDTRKRNYQLLNHETGKAEEIISDFESVLKS